VTISNSFTERAYGSVELKGLFAETRHEHVVELQGPVPDTAVVPHPRSNN